MLESLEGTFWLPSDWLDESFPSLVEHPDKLLVNRDGRWFVEHEESEEDEDEPGKFSFLFEVVDGQTVAFLGRRVYGDFKITLAEDGTWTGGGWPPDTTNFSHEDWSFEDVAETIEEVISGSGCMGTLDPLPPGEHTIHCWYWSDSVYWRFDIVDGQGRFVQVEDPNVIH